MSLFKVMNQQQVCALPEKYCTSVLDCTQHGVDGPPIVTHPKYPALIWNKDKNNWEEIRLGARG